MYEDIEVFSLVPIVFMVLYRPNHASNERVAEICAYLSLFLSSLVLYRLRYLLFH